MSVSHVGSISTPNLLIFDTYLVPKLFLNLLLVGQLVEHGCVLTFSNKGCDVQDQKTSQLVGIGRKVNRRF